MLFGPVQVWHAFRNNRQVCLHYKFFGIGVALKNVAWYRLLKATVRQIVVDYFLL